MTTPQPPNPLLVNSNVFPFAPSSIESSVGTVSELEQSLPANEIACVTCMDFRELPRHGYTLCSAGAIPHDEVRAGLGLILADTKLLILRGHTDCAKSKAEIERHLSESDHSYSARVEARTIERLWQGAVTLLSDRSVAAAVNRGMIFCIALLDVETRQVEYFERQSAWLAHEICSPS